MIRMNRSTSILAGAVAVGALMLSGCSAGGQSAADACAELDASMTDAATEVQSALTEFATDPAAATEQLSAFSDEFNAAVEEVSNDDVKAAATDAAGSFEELVAQLDAAGTDAASLDTEALTTTSTAVQEDFTTLGEVCAS